MLDKIVRRLRALFYRNSLERELDDELSYHLQREIENNVKDGSGLSDARNAALKTFGGLEQAKEECREARGVGMIENLLRDLRYGFRILWRNPGFSIVALLTLAVGIGINTATFSVVSAVLLRPLPYQQPDQLVKIWLQKAPTSVSKAEFVDIKQNCRSFSDVAAFSGWSFTLTGIDEPAKLEGAQTTASFFSLLGIKTELGRTFLPDEDQPGHSHVAMLSHDTWQRRFGADENVIGRSINLDGQSYRVIGVLKPDFKFPTNSYAESPLELIAPATMDSGDHDDFTAGYLNVIGRLKEGIKPEQANAEVTTFLRSARIRYNNAPDNYGLESSIVPLQIELTGNVRPMLLVLLGAVGLILLIACTNVANLQLARATSRTQEISVRVAIGASRGRVIRQLLTESVLLSLVGGVLGILLGFWCTKVLVSVLPVEVPRLNSIHLDSRVLAFSFFVSLLTGVLFGLAPALQCSRVNLQTALKETGRTLAHGSGGRMRNLFVVAEVALSLTLLIGAGLLVKSFWRLTQVDPGFNAEKVLTLQLAPPSTEYADGNLKRAFYSQVIERVSSLPGVNAVGGIHLLPMGKSNWDPALRVEDHPLPEGADLPSVDWRLITPNYFQAMDVHLLRGRFFTPSDNQNGPSVAIVNETLARRYWPNDDAIGKRIRGGFEGRNWVPIVGVVGDVKEQGLDVPTHLEMYRPYDQAPFTSSLRLMIRANIDPIVLTNAVRREVSAVGKDVPVADVQLLDRVVAQSLGSRRSTMLTLVAFALIALVLGAIGIFGVVSYMVSNRTHEIGIRMALGADSRSVLGLVVSQGLRLALYGIVIGIFASLIVMRLLQSLLFGVSSTDVLTFATVAVIVFAVALLACLLPARRATSVDPMVALRCE